MSVSRPSRPTDGLRSSHPRGQWDEVPGRRQLHVYLQVVLDRRQGPQHRVLVGTELDVHGDRRLQPTEEHGRAATDEVARTFARRGRAARLHEPLDALRVGQLTHAARGRPPPMHVRS